MTKKNKILAIAQRVRKKYDAIAKRARQSPCLAGYCARASMTLYRELQKVGIRSRLALVSYPLDGAHCFLMVGKDILDVTATQFSGNLPDVYFGPRNDAMKRLEWWKRPKLISPRELIKETVDWENYQRVAA